MRKLREAMDEQHAGRGEMVDRSPFHRKVGRTHRDIRQQQRAAGLALQGIAPDGAGTLLLCGARRRRRRDEGGPFIAHELCGFVDIDEDPKKKPIDWALVLGTKKVRKALTSILVR
jgi:hypothetical protein